MVTSRKYGDDPGGGPRGVDVPAPPALQKLTVNLVARAVASLEEIANATGATKTDVVNRAIHFYAYTIREKDAGKRLLIQDPETGEIQQIVLL
jgi:hypothetical protein